MTETKQEQQQPQPAQQKLARVTFPNMLERFKNEIARALPRHLNPDRMCRIALTEFRKNPKLADCDPRSVFAAVVIASQLGLEPGIMGQCFLIPYKTECQLIPGYQGLLDLVRRSGLVRRIEAHVVRDGEKFSYRTGLRTVLEHEPHLDGTSGALRLVYAVAEFKDGGYHVEVMTKEQVETIRDRSQNYIAAQRYKKETPWDTDTEEMWRKTALRRIAKYLPKSPELATALALDSASEAGEQKLNVQDAIDGTWAPVLSVETIGDSNLAGKSAANLEEIKERYAAKNEPQAQEQRPENGASQQPTPEPSEAVPSSSGGEPDSAAPVAATDSKPVPHLPEETAQEPQPEAAPIPEENMALMRDANPFEGQRKRRK